MPGWSDRADALMEKTLGRPIGWPSGRTARRRFTRPQVEVVGER
jgi:hypothetical protein